MLIQEYLVHVNDGDRNPTGETFTRTFPEPLTLATAINWCREQTRASSNHDGAFSYSVVYPEGF